MLYGLGAALSLAGCNAGPPPVPSDDTGRQVVERLMEQSSRQFGSQARLVRFEKTNGQRQEVNGVRLYTMDYNAQFECVRSASTALTGMLGDPCPRGRRAGHPFSRRGTLRFEETEQGWRAEDGSVY